MTADNLGLGTTRTYDSRQNLTQSGGLGSGWTLDDQPYVAANSNLTAVVFGPTQSYWFSNNGPSFTPLDGAKETLTADTADHLLDFAMPDGTVYTFNDFSYSDARAGQFAARYSPGGGIERVTATARRRPDRRDPVAGLGLRRALPGRNLQLLHRGPETRPTSAGWSRSSCKATTARRWSIPAK